ncbi:hypothetical protein ACFP3I_09760 [Chryseobacterium arachidis]
MFWDFSQNQSRNLLPKIGLAGNLNSRKGKIKFEMTYYIWKNKTL